MTVDHRATVTGYRNRIARGMVVAGLVGLLSPPVLQAAVPESFVRMDTLTLTAGHATPLALNLPSGETWAQANVAQLVLRTYGRQERLTIPPATVAPAPALTVPHPGPAMLILSAGPGHERGKSDAWQRTPYCAKFYLRVVPDPDAPQAAQVPAPDPGETGKVGQKIEIVPGMAPTTLRVGDHLAVRVYFDNASQTGARVTAYRPDGSTDVQTTRSKGFAVFRITHAGRWLIRYRNVAGDTTYTADLVFQVPGAAEHHADGNLRAGSRTNTSDKTNSRDKTNAGSGTNPGGVSSPGGRSVPGDGPGSRLKSEGEGR